MRVAGESKKVADSLNGEFRYSESKLARNIDESRSGRKQTKISKMKTYPRKLQLA